MAQSFDLEIVKRWILIDTTIVYENGIAALNAACPEVYLFEGEGRRDK
jgi:hypothetical protein